MSADPYANPVTGVLRNKLGLGTAEELAAGQIRTVAIAEGSPFCLPQYIESASADIFRALRGENLLQGLQRGPFLDRLTSRDEEVAIYEG